MIPAASKNDHVWEMVQAIRSKLGTDRVSYSRVIKGCVLGSIVRIYARAEDKGKPLLAILEINTLVGLEAFHSRLHTIEDEGL